MIPGSGIYDSYIWLCSAVSEYNSTGTRTSTVALDVGVRDLYRISGMMMMWV